MTDDFGMYGDDNQDDEQPKQPGPMAMLARKVDRLEAELREARDEIAKLRRYMDASMKGVSQLRNKMSVAETSLDTMRNRR